MRAEARTPCGYTLCWANKANNEERLLKRKAWLDYLGNRTFRKSLLSRADRLIAESPSVEALQRFFVSSDLRPVAAGADLASSEPVRFCSSTKDEVTTNKPHVKLALNHLATHAPRPVPFGSIWPAIQSHLHDEGDPNCSPTSLAEALMQCFQGNLVEFMVSDYPYVLEVTARPTASPLARSQAMKTELVANLRHRLVRLSDLERIVLAHLNGTRDRSALCDVVYHSIDRGELDLVDKAGNPVQAEMFRRTFIENAIDPCLQQLAAHALLAR
jgi:methyltransferase-like protein